MKKIFRRNAVHPGDTKAIAKDADTLWISIRSRGLSLALRVTLWPFLLGCQEGKHVAGWQSQAELIALAQNEALAHASYADKGGTESWTATVGRIARDADRISHEARVLSGGLRADGIERLNRLLVAYALHDCQVGYCQGMADLAVPFLELYPDDEQAFAVFRAFMARVRRNFLPGMHDIQRQMRVLGSAVSQVDQQLHRHLVAISAGNYIFAFQMLLLQLRREVTLPDTFTLWERMWASEELLTAARHERQQQKLRQQESRSRSASWGFLWRPASATAAAVRNAAEQRPTAATEATGPTAANAAAPEGAAGDGGGPAGGAWQPSCGEAAAALPAGAPPAQQPPDAVAPLPPGGAHASDTERVDLRVYVVAAALLAQRRVLLGCRAMEEVVQFVNRFPPPTDVVALVRDAERIYRVCEEGGGRGRRGGAAAAGAGVGPLRILSGCVRPRPPPAAAESHAWAVAPCDAAV